MWLEGSSQASHTVHSLKYFESSAILIAGSGAGWSLWRRDLIGYMPFASSERDVAVQYMLKCLLHMRDKLVLM